MTNTPPNRITIDPAICTGALNAQFRLIQVFTDRIEAIG
jgi:hypothetical protein